MGLSRGIAGFLTGICFFIAVFTAQVAGKVAVSDCSLCHANGDCSTEGATHYCLCQSGYSGNGTDCTDINECSSTSFYSCPDNSQCKNNQGSYSCVCNTMYLKNGTECIAKTCENANPCGSSATCSIGGGSFQCSCKPGYAGLTCIDIDECLDANLYTCPSNSQCVNNQGSYDCVCDTMYLRNGSECVAKTCENANPCGAAATCSLSGGSFLCSCDPGYAGLTCLDIDECSSDTHDCHVDATCTNTAGSFSCACNTMYQGNGTFCEDIDECASSGINNCHKHATCLNTVGSYRCICNTMFTGNGTFCEAQTCENSNPCGKYSDCTLAHNAFQCTCRDGFTGGLACFDIDECASSGDSKCHKDATCSNTAGSYTCICNTMFTGNGTFCEAKTCENSNPCGRHSDCTLAHNAFQCTCRQGFTGGLACFDVDECSSPSLNDCHNDATCSNTEGSHECTCKQGFIGNGTYCEDIDECASSGVNDCHKDATCLNTAGSYRCICNTMFTGNGTFCEDVDECASSDLNNCHKDATCLNTVGSYRCICNTMFTGNGTFCEAKTCENSNPCGEHSDCTVARNAFQCTCRNGFTGGLACFDINECDSGPCQANTTCVNTPGSFRCECPTCPERSKCVLNDDSDIPNCLCDAGFEMRDGACLGLCVGRSILGIYNFPNSIVGDIAFSTEKCSDGRAKASVTCTTIGDKFKFDNSTFREVSCEETIQALAAKWTEVSGDDLEGAVSQLNILTSSGAELPKKDRQAFLNIVNSTSSSLLNKTDEISQQTLREMVVAADSVTDSIRAELKNQSDGPDEALVKEVQVLVRGLQIFAAKVTLGEEVITVTTKNIHAQVTNHLPKNDTTYKCESRKLKVSVPREAIDQANEQTNATERIVCLEYNGKALFPTEDNFDTVITVEVGINVSVRNLQNKLEFSSLEENPNFTEPQPIPGKTQMQIAHPKCTYYIPENNAFSTEGCCLVRNTTPLRCLCDHMTSFAVLVEHEIVDENIALSIVTTIGCVLSIVGLVVAIAILLSERCNSRKSMQYNKRQATMTIYLNICVCLLGVYLTFLLGVSQTSHGYICTGISGILHYLLLVTWMWTTIYSYTTYISLAKVGVDLPRNYVKKSAVAAYGIPLTGVAITVLLNVGEVPEDKYESLFCKDDGIAPPASTHSIYGYRAPNMCWLTGNSLKFGFLVPAGIMLLVNYVFFTFLVYLLAHRRHKMKDATSRKTAKREITAAASMATTLGLTWAFGYMMLVSTDVVYRSIMAWIFTVTNVLQGVLLFTFTVVRRVELREKIYSSMKSRISSMSMGVTSRVRSVKRGRAFTGNTTSTLDESCRHSTTESTANLANFGTGSFRSETVISEQ